MVKVTPSVALLAVMVLGSGCASTPWATPAPVAASVETPRADAEQLSRAAAPGETSPIPTDCEAEARAAHNSHLTQLALRHGVAGTLYLSFVGAAQGAFYGAIAGGGNGAGQGAWIGAAVGAGVGLVLGSIEGWGRAREARTAYKTALASCRTAAQISPAPPATPPAEAAEPTTPTATLPE
jgi:hypothetical protein